MAKRPAMKVTIPDRAKLRGKIQTIEQLKFLRPYVRAAALYVKGLLARYPPARRGSQPFKTAKQRRYFFWALKEGIIEVPCFRMQNPKSENLAGSWGMKKEYGGLRYTVGTNVSYARWVMDRKQQSAYHKTTGWGTVQGIAEDPQVIGEVNRLIGKGVKLSLEKV
jgi:hypothetical protein